MDIAKVQKASELYANIQDYKRTIEQLKINPIIILKARTPDYHDFYIDTLGVDALKSLTDCYNNRIAELEKELEEL